MRDWTLVEEGIFHGFHTWWVAQIGSALNSGLLPRDYYAMPEQHTGQAIADVLTLHNGSDEPRVPGDSGESGGIAVAEAPPRVRRKRMVEQSLLARQRTVAIRHVTRHRLVAMIEIISPGNKSGSAHLEEFTAKAADALHHGVNLLVIDLFPPGQNDPYGIHGVIQQRLGPDEPYDLPADEPLTLAAYVADRPIQAYLEHLKVGALLPEMPLFLNPDRYINVPLPSTYDAAYAGMPSIGVWPFFVGEVMT